MTASPPDVETVEDRVVLDALDFEIPCSLYKPNAVPSFVPPPDCPHPAKWLLKIRPHCKFSKAMTHTICQIHYDMIIAAVPFTCSACFASFPLTDIMTLLEPLKGELK